MDFLSFCQAMYADSCIVNTCTVWNVMCALSILKLCIACLAYVLGERGTRGVTRVLGSAESFEELQIASHWPKVVMVLSFFTNPEWVWLFSYKTYSAVLCSLYSVGWIFTGLVLTVVTEIWRCGRKTGGLSGSICGWRISFKTGGLTQ